VEQPVRSYLCPEKHAQLIPVSNRDIFACPVCGWGVSGLEIQANRYKNVAAMIQDRVIGEPGSWVRDWFPEESPSI
jgi:hypothetical protein